MKPPQGHPPVSLELAAQLTATGKYTSIITLGGTPNPAGAGQLVTVSSSVKNLYTTPIYIALTGTYNDIDLNFNPEYGNVAVGGYQQFKATFYMPNKDVKIKVWSWYWTGATWVDDDSWDADVDLAVPVFSNLSATYRKV